MNVPSSPTELSPFGREESLLIAKTLQTHEHEPEQIDIKVITKSHWVSSDKRSNCSRRQCRKKFSFLERPHHCRRCGEVFCYDCTNYKKKLNKLAKPDPDGREYKVCEGCFKEGPQGIGCIRNLWDDFQEAKELCKTIKSAKERGQRRAGWRNRLDLEKECNRLLTGFKEELKRSEILKAIKDLQKMVAIPEWQKGANWLQEDLFSSCQSCGVTFNRFLNKKHHCRVCALAVCGNCSDGKLILYVPDEESASALKESTKWSISLPSLPEFHLFGRELEPRLSIIEVVGCPDKEPNICIYLRVCQPCQNALTELQVKKHRSSITVTEEDVLLKLCNIWEDFLNITLKVEEHLHKYCDTIDSLENNSSGNETKGVQSQSNMKTLAKAQTDLSDFFTAYIMKVNQLKKFKNCPASPAQAKLLQNFVKAKCEYYLENMYTFRTMKNKMAAISLPETLELIQRIVDKDAIICTHLYVKQLLFEVLHLTNHHAVLPKLPALLVQVEQTVEKEAKSCLKREGDDWETHTSVSQQILHSQIKKHKLIRPSRHMLKTVGSVHIHDITIERSLHVIEKVRLQLQIKSAHSSFRQSIKDLQQCQDQILQI